MTKPNSKSTKWDILAVSERFEEAASTLKRIPEIKVQGYFNAWPEVVRSSVEISRMEKRPMRLPPPSAGAISQMDECFEWINWLDDETERRLIWLRANRVYWKQICSRVGYGRTKSWQLYTMALLKIVTRLNARRYRDLHFNLNGLKKN